MTRNCHKSVFNALLSGDISPVCVSRYRFRIRNTGSCLSFGCRRGFAQEPEAEAVILPSPQLLWNMQRYPGYSRSGSHRYGKLLIVDQAHGAHLKFFEGRLQEKYGIHLSFPPSAESSGADIVMDSTHKTLASFTQTAVLNVFGKRPDIKAL